jgi:hypothetical protein
LSRRRRWWAPAAQSLSDRGAEALGRIHFTDELAATGVLQQTPL